MSVYVNVDTIKHLIDIKTIPTADVVEVVRCRDCEDWQDDWIPSCGDNGSHYCATMDSVMKPTDYCSYGERRA